MISVEQFNQLSNSKLLEQFSMKEFILNDEIQFVTIVFLIDLI
jgi:hypothetical protein